MSAPDEPLTPSLGDGLSLADVVAHLAGSGVTARSTGDQGVRVTGVTLDSRRVSPGDLYAALPGSRVHGADHWTQARDSGAVAVLTDPDGLDRIGAPDAEVAAVVVASPRQVLGSLAAEVYGRPPRRPTSTACSGGWSTPGSRPAPWRCRATPW